MHQDLFYHKAGPQASPMLVCSVNGMYGIITQLFMKPRTTVGQVAHQYTIRYRMLVLFYTMHLMELRCSVGRIYTNLHAH